MWNIYLHFEIQYLWKYNYIFGHHGNHANCTLRKTTLKRSLAGQPSVFQDVLLDVGRHNLTTCHVLNRKGKGIGNGIQYMLLSSTSVYIAFLEWKIIHEFSTKSSQPAFLFPVKFILVDMLFHTFFKFLLVEPCWTWIYTYGFTRFFLSTLKPEISVSQTIFGHFFPELTLSCLRFPAAKFERWNCTSNCARQIALWRVRMQQATPSQLGTCFFHNISSHRSEFVPLDTLGIHVSKQKLKTTKIWHISWMRWHKLGSMG